jgi:hypothetical protein
MVQIFHLKIAVFHSEPHTSNHGPPFQLCPSQFITSSRKTASLWFLSHLTNITKYESLDASFFGLLKSALSCECRLFMKSHPYETVHMEFIPSTFNTAYQNIAANAKAVSEFVKQAFNL